MRWIKKDESGKVVMASNGKFDETFELSEEEYDVGFDGKLYSETELQSDDYLARRNAFDNSIALIELRNQREEECFSVINRGALWYDRLTEEQKQELSAWYQAWLDAPQTSVIPTKPAWLDDVSKQAVHHFQTTEQ